MKIPRKTLFALSAPLKLTPAPYAAAAKEIGISEKVLLKRLGEYQAKGYMKRVAIMFAHRQVGYTCNALVVWQAGDARLTEVGELFTTLTQVSHCYARRTYPNWPYDLYTMVHAQTEADLKKTIRMMVKRSGILQYQVLSTIKEFKKTKSDLREVLR